MIFAYIDPALGSMLLQAIAGVMIAMVVMGRRILLKPLEWLNLKRQPHDDNSPKSSAEENP